MIGLYQRFVRRALILLSNCMQVPLAVLFHKKKNLMMETMVKTMEVMMPSPLIQTLQVMIILLMTILQEEIIKQTNT